ncbi:hypothetical protein HMPREF0731_4039 [Pseudoroseomonas cervicalis ATCC 49957]|uniref:Uncharacterized protein n=1 Tax=Pseudoroseomonas cervicalis ATCC 49957 TaxID=525371 RepID=D5RSH7_9PROT|nr:hypothetical protein HMPREF0731_4039 [Pseudoroseomonas cervicalis ATCC 49957]
MDGRIKKEFFFVKKNQKTFSSLAARLGPEEGRQRKEVFLLLFLQKKKASSA